MALSFGSQLREVINKYFGAPTWESERQQQWHRHKVDNLITDLKDGGFLSGEPE